MPYIKSTCRAGRTKEICRYYTKRIHPKGEKRSRRKEKTSEKQRAVNDRNLVRKLTYILNDNFDGTSWYITYSYAVENRPDVDELKSHRRELLKNLRKLYRDNGKVLKYVETAEVGKRGATHIHMVVNDIDIRLVKDIWKYGYVTAKPMDDTGHYRKLAEYFIKYYQKTRGTSEQIQKKAYNCSRNLSRPEPRKRAMRGNRFPKEIRVPEGWYLDKEGVREGITEDGYEFMYYTIIQIRRRNRDEGTEFKQNRPGHTGGEAGGAAGSRQKMQGSKRRKAGCSGV